MKTVLLLGATGQLGSLVQALSPADVNLVALSHQDLDISSPPALEEMINSVRPDTVINCAAYTAVDKAEDDREAAFRVNAGAVEALARTLPDSTRLIHLSTDFVFQALANRPYKPDDTPAPVSVYAKSKLAGEKAVQAWHADNSVILRTSWLYSATGRNFMTTMLRLMGEGKSLKVVADQYGSPTAAGTLAEVVWRFAQATDTRGIYHWSDHGVVSWYDFAVEIYRMGRELGVLDRAVSISPVSTAEYPTSATRPHYSALDSSATETALGIRTLPWTSQLGKVLASLKQANSHSE